MVLITIVFMGFINQQTSLGGPTILVGFSLSFSRIFHRFGTSVVAERVVSSNLAAALGISWELRYYLGWVTWETLEKNQGFYVLFTIQVWDLDGFRGRPGWSFQHVSTL